MRVLQYTISVNKKTELKVIANEMTPPKVRLENLTNGISFQKTMTFLVQCRGKMHGLIPIYAEVRIAYTRENMVS